MTFNKIKSLFRCRPIHTVCVLVFNQLHIYLPHHYPHHYPPPLLRMGNNHYVPTTLILYMYVNL